MATKASSTKLNADGRLYRLPLHLLHLDIKNPRFGGRGNTFGDESRVVDEVVGQHGITDVISSIAANAYFDAEPLVGAINKEHGAEVTIVEGNRRLTACMVLAGDPRADRHEKLREQYRDSAFKAGDRLPVQVFDWNNASHRRRLLPYLGVRHIVGGQQWDSFAKAAWVAETLSDQSLTLDDIRIMIGDNQSFTDRIVEGYYFVDQVDKAKAYDPANSLRRGRGSFQGFPFSWVYTALGYRNVRDFLGLSATFVTRKLPLNEDKLEDAGQLLTFMFGGEGKNAAIDDSRKIGSLARALGEEASIDALRRGATAEQAIEESRPPEDRLTDSLKRADKALADSISVASGMSGLEREPHAVVAGQAEVISTRVDRLLQIVDDLGKTAKRLPRRGN